MGISALDDMNELELELLEQLYLAVLIDDLPDRRLCVEDLNSWHRRWLGNVYTWAGKRRALNISKGNFMFAAAAQIPRLLDEFERNCLARWTPCHGMTEFDLTEAIAVTHIEFILVHPFREGNGRLSRLLADVMAVQAGRAPLDYSSWETRKAEYINAIHAGHAGNYTPMVQRVAEAMGLADFKVPA